MSIVAGLIIGDAAVASGLISTPMLTVTAIAVIAGFVVPDLAQSITLLRLAFLLIAGFWGLFGISRAVQSLCRRKLRLPDHSTHCPAVQKGLSGYPDAGQLPQDAVRQFHRGGIP